MFELMNMKSHRYYIPRKGEALNKVNFKLLPKSHLSWTLGMILMLGSHHSLAESEPFGPPTITPNIPSQTADDPDFGIWIDGQELNVEKLQAIREDPQDEDEDESVVEVRTRGGETVDFQNMSAKRLDVTQLRARLSAVTVHAGLYHLTLPNLYHENLDKSGMLYGLKYHRLVSRFGVSLEVLRLRDHVVPEQGPFLQFIGTTVRFGGIYRRATPWLTNQVPVHFIIGGGFEQSWISFQDWSRNMEASPESGEVEMHTQRTRRSEDERGAYLSAGIEVPLVESIWLTGEVNVSTPQLFSKTDLSDQLLLSGALVGLRLYF
jgi:hypothetical protein